MNGFINVIKPVGATASDVVVCLKHVLKTKKIGHLGTLDPGASGVLPIAVGGATRLFDFLTNKVKYYRAFITFGKTTDTLDSYGVVTDRCNNLPTRQQIEDVLQTFLGEQQQIPPIYSAISVGGVRSYKLARNGEEISLPSRSVTVFGIQLIDMPTADTCVVDIKCSGGTYIRSLARDIAASCGTVGYMSGLIRLQSGCFCIADAYTLDEVKALGEQCLLDVTYPLTDLPTYEYDAKYFDDINFGRKIPCLFGDGYHKVYCNGTLFGLGINENGTLRLQYYLKNFV